MNLSFNKRFVKPIKLCFKTDGKQGKIHSVREDLHNRWKPGMKIHFCTGMRTKLYNRFIKKTPPCVSVQEIIMKCKTTLEVIDFEIILKETGKPINQVEFAYNDGFGTRIGEALTNMLNWFVPIVKKHGGTYNAKIIHWTNFKY